MPKKQYTFIGLSAGGEMKKHGGGYILKKHG